MAVSTPLPAGRKAPAGPWPPNGLAKHAPRPRRVWAWALHAVRAAGAVTAWGLSACGGGTAWASEKPLDQVPTPALEAHCQAIPHAQYVSGQVDGGWGNVLPGAGATYFLRSRCYLELVRRTGRTELCPLVVQRRSLLGDGSAYTPQHCEAVARETQARQAEARQRAAAHAEAVAGRFVLGPLSARVLPNGDWLLQAQATGQAPGPYRVQVLSSRDQRTLLGQALALQGDTTLQWTLPRAAVVGQARLPNIFPIAVLLHHPMPPDAQGRVQERTSSIQNITLSAE